MSESLPPEFAAALAGASERIGGFGHPACYFTETSSTNDVAAVLAERGATQGTMVLASSQTAGRGRLGREWFSPPGAGLYVSLVIREPAAAPYLALAGGVAVAEGVRASTGLPVEIKWPNDVVAVAGSAFPRRRKLAGILAEGSSGPDAVQYVVLGFGVNLRPAAYPPEIAERATSIEAELGRAPDAPRVLVEILATLAELVGLLAVSQRAPLLARWRALAPSCRGSRVRWDTASGPRSGIASGIDDDGALLVQVAGRTERIISGEVRWT
jgi:BirA family biotin operon repressor/biotin-[acetyl-CoA-carboxylase] ligase